jgi:hypothetical protein
MRIIGLIIAGLIGVALVALVSRLLASRSRTV